MFEVDFPDVAKRKAALIKGSPTLTEVCGPRLPPVTGWFPSSIRLHRGFLLVAPLMLFIARTGVCVRWSVPAVGGGS